MATTNRKARNTMSKKHKELDLTKPIPLDILGTEYDPCFGKLHDATASECQICGDSELCAIVQSQRLHVKREAIESEKEFKDLGKKKKSAKKKKKK